MQNRGAIKAIAIILAIACAYQLSFTFVARNIEKKAARYAEGFPVELQQERQQSYLDSIKSQKVFLGFTYKQVKEREINLGLDLKGGMNVMLEISVEDVVRALSNDSQDPIFNAALSQARSEQKNSAEDFITLFSRAYADLSGNAPLALIFNTQELREKNYSHQHERTGHPCIEGRGRKCDRQLVQRSAQPYRPLRRHAAQYPEDRGLGSYPRGTSRCQGARTRTQASSGNGVTRILAYL